MDKQFNVEEVSNFENETWSRCAKTYMDGFGVLAKEAIKPLLDEAKVNSGKRVLDLGTGPGLTAAAAKDRGADVVGVDFSNKMLIEARSLYPDIDFHNASIESLPFNVGEFDIVIGNFVLHHSGNPEKALSEAFRVLKPGGRLGLTVWADLTKLEAFGLFFAAVEEHAGAAELPHGPLFGISDFDVFHQMLKDAGSQDSSVKQLDIEWKTSSIDSYITAFGD